jgi:hypothetical protein
MRRWALVPVFLFTAAAADPPDYRFFVERVEPIFLKKRTGSGRCYDCHSLASNQALFHLEALPESGTWTEEQSRRNFENAAHLITPGEPLKSRLLTHPLAEAAGGGPFHTCGKFWTSRDDPEWQTLADWVRGATVK